MTNTMSPDPGERPVLFYDGDCGLCARAVQWSLEHDRRGRLRFAPLQGSTFAALEFTDKPQTLETMVLLERGRLLVRSDALLALLREVGGPWRVAALLGRMVPRFLRDACYRFIARRRHALFRSVEHCRMPDPAERGRFLP